MDKLKLIEEVCNSIDVITCAKQRFEVAVSKRGGSDKNAQITVAQNFTDDEAIIFGGIQRVGRVLEDMLSNISKVRETVQKPKDNLDKSYMCLSNSGKDESALAEAIVHESASRKDAILGDARETSNDLIKELSEGGKEFTNSLSSSTFLNLCLEGDKDFNSVQTYTIRRNETNSCSPNAVNSKTSKNFITQASGIPETPSVSEPVDDLFAKSGKSSFSTTIRNTSNDGAQCFTSGQECKPSNGLGAKTDGKEETVTIKTSSINFSNTQSETLQNASNYLSRKRNGMLSEILSSQRPSVSLNNKRGEFDILSDPASCQPVCITGESKRVCQISTKELFESDSDDTEDILNELEAMGSTMRNFMSRLDVLTKANTKKAKRSRVDNSSKPTKTGRALGK